jgi:hypothetical protein
MIWVPLVHKSWNEEKCCDNSIGSGGHMLMWAVYWNRGRYHVSACLLFNFFCWQTCLSKQGL